MNNEAIERTIFAVFFTVLGLGAGMLGSEMTIQTKNHEITQLKVERDNAIVRENNEMARGLACADACRLTISTLIEYNQKNKGNDILR